MEHALKYYWSELGRPLEVYAELYGRAHDHHTTKEANASQGLVVSVALAFFIVVSAAVGLRAAESSLKIALGTHYAAVPASVQQSTVTNTSATEGASAVLPPHTSSSASGILRNAIFQYVAQSARTLFGVETAQAATVDYAASLAGAPPNIHALPGERQLIQLKFTNEGSYNWRRKGRSFISLYARPPKGAATILHDASWMSARQVARISDVLVGPGRAGFIEFYIRAPKKIGASTEHFQLAAENAMWVQGAAFDVTVQVTQEKNAKSQEDGASSAAVDSITLLPFPRDVWGMPAQDTQSTGTPAENITRASSSLNNATATTTAAAVSSTAAIFLAAPVINTFSTTVDASNIPLLNVGLYRALAPVEFVSDNNYELYNADNSVYGQIVAGTHVTLAYDAAHALYSAQSDTAYATSTTPLRLAAQAGGGIFTLVNAVNHLGRTTKINYNQFRGAVELNFSGTYTWVINTVSMEEYLQGLAESGPGTPAEFQKALAIAARSYAYAHLQSGAKHAHEGFDVDAEYDQIYKGIVREHNNPEWAQAVTDTSGQVVTYQGTPVETPYFSQSNGRTRAYNTVWGGATRPWLVSVKTPYDRGHKRLGHGVGMSNHDAMIRAKKGATAEEILKYYYTDTAVQTMW